MNASFTIQKLDWLEAVGSDRDLSPMAAKVAIILCTKFMNGNERCAWPAVGTIADIMGVTARHVRSCLSTLVQRGYLLREINEGRHNTNRYFMTHPKEKTGNPVPVFDEKTGKILPGSNGKIGTTVPENRNDSSGGVGTIVPPNPLTEPIEEPKGVTPLTPQGNSERAVASDRDASVLPSVAVRTPIDGRHDGGHDGEILNPRSFEAFWEIYPKKQGQKAARAAFHAAVDAGADPLAIVVGAGRYAKSRAEDPREPQIVARYTATPAKWLADERWHDVPMTAHSAATDNRQQNDKTSLAMQIAAQVTSSLADAEGF